MIVKHKTRLKQTASRLDIINNDSCLIANDDVSAIKSFLIQYQYNKHTFISYRQAIERFYLWLNFNHLSLATLKNEHVQHYYDFLACPSPLQYWCGRAVSRSSPNWKPFVSGLCSKSIQLNKSIIALMYNYLIASGYLNRNPFNLVKYNSRDLIKSTKIDKYLNEKEWNCLLNNIELMPRDSKHEVLSYERVRWIFNLLYLTACRRSEIINARMSDVFYREGGWWLKVIGKGNKYGEIPVIDSLLHALTRYRRSLGLPDLSCSSETDIYLVNNVRSCAINKFSAISDKMLNNIIKNTCCFVADKIQSCEPETASVLRCVSAHWLRHTSATHQVNAGIDIRIVKENLRHSDIRTTMHYQHTESITRHNETNAKFGNNSIYYP